MTQANQPGRLNTSQGADTPFPPLDMAAVALEALRSQRHWRVEFTEAGMPMVWSGHARCSASAIHRAAQELADKFPDFHPLDAQCVLCVEVL